MKRLIVASVVLNLSVVALAQEAPQQNEYQPGLIHQTLSNPVKGGAISGTSLITSWLLIRSSKKSVTSERLTRANARVELVKKQLGEQSPAIAQAEEDVNLAREQYEATVTAHRSRARTLEAVHTMSTDEAKAHLIQDGADEEFVAALEQAKLSGKKVVQENEVTVQAAEQKLGAAKQRLQQLTRQAGEQTQALKIELEDAQFNQRNCLKEALRDTRYSRFVKSGTGYLVGAFAVGEGIYVIYKNSVEPRLVTNAVELDSITAAISNDN